MDLKDLEIFKELAYQQNITKTANKFNYVQSNITNRLTKIEKEVGHTLFIRTNKGVFLTNEGKIFLTYVHKIQHLYEEAIQALHAEYPMGNLTIGATDIMTADRLPAIFNAFLEAYPNVDFSLKNGSTEELIADILNFNIEGAFVTDEIHHPSIQFAPLLTEELVLISTNEHAIIKSLKDLEKGTVLVFKQGCTYRRRMEDWIHQEGLLVKKIEFGTIEGLISCVQAGLGVAMISKNLASKLTATHKLQFHSVPNQFSTVKTGFIYRIDVSATIALQRFRETIKMHYDNL